jgi:phthalate 4,5-dioxygenase
MLPREKNELITRVEPGHPMNEIIKSYWIPVGLSTDIPEPDADPHQIMALGEKYVLFRDSAGTPVVMNDACAHRGASLSLGRVEHGGIRCIYHGWKFDATGQLTDAPNVPNLAFVRNICQPRYPVREMGGILWAYLGDRAKEPVFPTFPFFSVPADRVHINRVVVNCNYVQVIEGVLDSAHHGVLHSDLHAKSLSMAQDGKPVLGKVKNQFVAAKAPRVEVKDTDWGFRYAALRDVPGDDGSTVVQARVTAFSMPFCSVVAGRFNALFAVPVHSGQTIHYHTFCDLEGTSDSKAWLDALVAAHGFERAYCERGHPSDGFVTKTSPIEQDRSAMRHGRLFAGIDNVILEDVAVTESMGRISDRSIEHLVQSDAAVSRLRRLLFENVRRLQAGEKLIGIDREEEPVGAEGAVTAEAPWPMLVAAI